jgi:outer membrane protein TolC
MKLMLFILIISMPVLSVCQNSDTLTIFKCFELAYNYYPAAKQTILYKNIYSNKLDNIRSNWYPNVSFNGQTTYQSDVTSIQVPNIELPSQPHDQYKLFFEINQQIFDGGVTSNSKRIEATNLEVELQNIDIELNSIKRRITSVYFSILYFDLQHELVNLTLNELREKLVVVESGIKNGVLMPQDLYVLQAEILKLEQKDIDILMSREAMLKALSELTGVKLDTAVCLSLPHHELVYTSDKLRLEYELFDLQKKQIDANNKLLTTANKPRLFAFSQTGYGKPGLNMLNDEFDTYYLVGFGLKWNFFNWGDIKRKEKILNSQKEIIDTKIETFSKNLNISLENEMVNIEKYRKSVTLDNQIVQLRSEIRESSFSQLKNGVITSTDFVSDLNAEMQAKLQLETHIILLHQSIFNYLTLKGEI